MPTYEYECKKCSHRFEVFQSMSDEPIKKCPECGKQVRRLVSGGAGVIFKGSGFYVTDKQEKAPTELAAPVKSAAEKKKEKAPTKLAAEKKEDKTVTSNVSGPQSGNAATPKANKAGHPSPQ